MNAAPPRRRSYRFPLFALLVLVTAAGPAPVKPAGKPSGGRWFGCGGSRVPVSPVRLARPSVTPAVKPPLAGPRVGARDPAAPPARLEPLRPAVAGRSWKKVVALAALPAAGAGLHPDAEVAMTGVGSRGRQLEALQELQTAVARPWGEKPPTAEALEGGLAKLPPGPETERLRDDLRGYLVRRAQVEGHPALAERLNGGKAPDGGRGALRDLKALGEAPEVVVPPEVLPALAALPLPEAEPLTLKAPVKEALGADLPTLEALPPAEKQARGRLSGRLDRAAALPWHSLHVHLATLETHGLLTPRLEADAAGDGDDEKATVAEVEARLERALRPEERLLVRHLRGAKTTEELAAILAADGQ